MKTMRHLFLLLFFLLLLIAHVDAKERDLVKIGSDLVVEEGMRVGDAVAIGGDIGNALFVDCWMDSVYRRFAQRCRLFNRVW